MPDMFVTLHSVSCDQPAVRFANSTSPALCTVVVIVSEPNVTFTADLDECASSSDIVYCLRIFLNAYNVTACVNLNGTVEQTPAAAVLGIASNLLVFQEGGKVVLQILSPTPIYRNALVTGLVKKDGCRDTSNGFIYINGRCVHMQRSLLCVVNSPPSREGTKNREQWD